MTAVAKVSSNGPMNVANDTKPAHPAFTQLKPQIFRFTCGMRGYYRDHR